MTLSKNILGILLLFGVIGSTVTCGQTIDHDLSKDQKEILKTILNTPQFKKYHHPELENRMPLYLLNDGQFDNVKLSGVKVVDDTLGTKGNYIEISKLVIKKREAEFELYYKIENVNMGGSLVKKNKEWHLDQFDYIVEL